MVKCNFCGAEVEDGVTKCRYCGEWINDAARVALEKEQLQLVKKERARLKAQNQNRSCLLSLVLLVAMGWLLTSIINSGSGSATTPNGDILEEKLGSYGDYSYTVSSPNPVGRYAVTFRPFLARDDSTVVGAFVKLVKDVYGETLPASAEVGAEWRDNGGAIYLLGQQGRYYFLPIKEDTGEVHSATFWRE